MGALPLGGGNAIDAQVVDLRAGDASNASSVGNVVNAANKRRSVSTANQSREKLADAWQLQARKNTSMAVRQFFYVRRKVPIFRIW